MKKLLLLLFLAFSLSSCYEDVTKSVSNPLKETTSYLQNLPKDTTVTVAHEGHNIYVFDKKTNLIKYKADSNEGASLPIHSVLIFLLVIFAFFFGMIILYDIINNG